MTTPPILPFFSKSKSKPNRTIFDLILKKKVKYFRAIRHSLGKPITRKIKEDSISSLGGRVGMKDGDLEGGRVGLKAGAASDMTAWMLAWRLHAQAGIARDRKDGRQPLAGLDRRVG